MKRGQIQRWIFVIVFLALALIVAWLTFSNIKDDQAVRPTQPTHIVPTVTDTCSGKDGWDKETCYGVQRWVAPMLPIFSCDRVVESTDFITWTDIRYCPDYTASVELRGQGFNDKPVIQNAVAPDGTPMITILSHWGSQGWYFTYQVHHSLMTCINVQFAAPEGWKYGPVDCNVPLVWHQYSANTVRAEIYGADRAMVLSATPIAADKLGGK